MNRPENAYLYLAIANWKQEKREINKFQNKKVDVDKLIIKLISNKI